MKHIEKRLPDGFVYVLTKKEIMKINASADNCIGTLTEDGTSYSETKMATNWTKSITVLMIKTETVDFNLIFNLKLYGIRKSNFTDKEMFIQFKSKTKDDLIKKINSKKIEFKDSIIKHDLIFLSFNKEK